MLLMMDFVVAVFGPACEIHRWSNEHNQDVKRRRSLTQEIGDYLGKSESDGLFSVQIAAHHQAGIQRAGVVDAQDIVCIVYQNVES